MDTSMVKSVVKRALGSRLAWRLVGPVLRPSGVIVLMYHRVVPNSTDGGELPGIPVDRFAAQMRWIRDNCDPIAPEAIIERTLRPSRLRPAVLVTFDDGYRDYHDLAYPVLRELGIPALVFLVTSLVDEGGMVWTNQVQWAAMSTRRTSIRLPWSDGPAIELPDAAARAALGARARAHLKTLPDAERQAAVASLLSELGEAPARPRDMLSWDEVRSTMDITRYGGHTHTHPILSRCSPAEAERELGTCRDRIAAETGRVPTMFAYPNGGPADYTPETQRILRKLGFAVAFSTSKGVATSKTDWMAVQRIAGEENLATTVYARPRLLHFGG